MAPDTHLPHTSSDNNSLRMSALQQMFQELADPASLWRCTDCHSIDETPDGLQVNWLGRHQQPTDHLSVKFSHSPHVTLMNCSKCHVFKDGPLNESFEFHHSEFWTLRGMPIVNTSPKSIATSGFQELEKSLCASCHQEKLVGDNCLKCHNYHVGHFQTVRNGSTADEPETSAD